VTIDCGWEDDCEGWYGVDETKADLEPEVVKSRLLTQYRRDRIKVIVAGPAVEMLLFRNPRFLSTRAGDCLQAFEVAERELKTDEEIRRSIARCFEKVVSLLISYQDALVTISKNISKILRLRGNNYSDLYRKRVSSEERDGIRDYR
jgi:hypothetical protein